MAMFSGELVDGSGRTGTQSVHGSSRRMRGPAPATQTPQVPARRLRSPSLSSVATTEDAGEIAAGKAGQGGSAVCSAVTSVDSVGAGVGTAAAGAGASDGRSTTAAADVTGRDVTAGVTTDVSHGFSETTARKSTTPAATAMAPRADPPSGSVGRS